ncbi:P-loop NTPase fold protein [Paenibacillus sp. GCM10023250]|uniref:P-loop NTPase fold protein n=1 Tax=Paenibacillus sp. GCM10023250 TaxID=3252648 RepID=UPI003610CCE1
MSEFNFESKGTNSSSSETPEYDVPNFNSMQESSYAPKGMQLPPYNKDQDFEVDRLNIGDDAEALARLAVMSKVENMAIGLFGSWGAGKSFFMQEMKRRVDRLAETNNPAFLSKVVHVEFNAWHYMDTNLYANLANHIYTKVHESVTGNSVLRGKWMEDIPSVIELKTERDQLLDKKEKQSQTISDLKDHLLKEEITKLGNSYLENLNENGEISRVTADALVALEARERGIKLAASVQSLRTRLRLVIRYTPRSAWFALSVFLAAGAAAFFGLSRSGDWNPNWAWLSPLIGVAAFIRETVKDKKVENAIKFCREAFGKIEAAARSKAQIQSEIEHTDQALRRIQYELEQIRSGKIIQYYLA